MVAVSEKVLECKLEWMALRHMRQVMAIEQEAFEFPWGEQDFLRVLRAKHVWGLVVMRQDEVVGFALYELHHNRLVVLNLAVANAWRRQGVGTYLMRHLQKALCYVGSTRKLLTLEVRETNLVAQQFFRAVGLKAVGLIRDYYEDTPEDAYTMQYRV